MQNKQDGGSLWHIFRLENYRSSGNPKQPRTPRGSWEVQMISESEMFNPEHYQAARRPLLEAETLPVWCYTSFAFYRREVERIWRKVWNFLGSADHIPNSGDYFTVTFAGVPLIVVRDEGRIVRAFVNSCRHRGSELLEGDGSCKLIVCPYHSWTYELDGGLRGAPEMEKTIGFN